MGVFDKITKPRTKEIPMVKVQNFITALQKMVRKVGHSSALNEVVPTQLYRFTWSIDDWQRAQDNAEDIYGQD